MKIISNILYWVLVVVALAICGIAQALVTSCDSDIHERESNIFEYPLESIRIDDDSEYHITYLAGKQLISLHDLDCGTYGMNDLEDVTYYEGESLYVETFLVDVNCTTGERRTVRKTAQIFLNEEEEVILFED